MKMYISYFLLLCILVLLSCGNPVDVASDPVVIFSDGFEEGLLGTMWFWDEHNWRGIKEIITDNPHTGTNCLFMKGSDCDGECSRMSTVLEYSLESVIVSLWARDVDLKIGGGGDGHVRVLLFDAENNQIGIAFETPYAAGGTWSWKWPGESWEDAPNSSVSLRNLSGWNELEIQYKADATSTVSLLVNDEVVLEREYNGDLGSICNIQVMAGGQYYNTGEWFIDDVQVWDVSY